ncbi:MAG: serine/threonine-protein phosphatase [Spirochaetes bacterium]|nr:serine/threonine-protein phosphatase [Spirochaetota bacterium]MBU0954931.1 serine/threonine-protein phosphatase [Spirochaetota bacterium]
MKTANTEAVLQSVLSILETTRAVLLALDSEERLVGVLPAGGNLGTQLELSLGQPLKNSVQANFIRVYSDDNEWDELAYFSRPGQSSTRGKPWQIHRYSGTGHAFSSLFADAASCILATPLPAYASLESLHEHSMADHNRELQAMNRKLRRRSHKLKEAMFILEQRNRQIINEMNLAVELQKSLLPKSYPATDLISFTHRYIPMAMVGGDFFDIKKLADNMVAILISDVSGHGVAPAFITAMIRSSFDYLVSKDRPPATVISLLNDEFSKIIDTDHYVTAFYAVLDFTTMTCRYCNAGHPHQLLIHADGSHSEMTANNPIIGMLDHYEYKDIEIPFSQGDLLCFFTDGIMEARDENGEMFGTAGIVESIKLSSTSGDLDTVADHLLTDLIQFMKDPYFDDDITILLAEILETL